MFSDVSSIEQGAGVELTQECLPPFPPPIPPTAAQTLYINSTFSTSHRNFYYTSHTHRNYDFPKLHQQLRTCRATDGVQQHHAIQYQHASYNKRA